MNTRYEIGNLVTFVHDGATIIGHIRGQSGLLFAIETAAYEIFEVHAGDIGGLVGNQSIEPLASHMAYLSGVYDVA